MSLPSRVGEFVRSLSRVQRELAVLGIGIFLGFMVMPGLTWAIGIVVFKTYAGGNTVFSLYGNFYKALAKGAPVFWLVAVGPYVLINVARLLIAMFRGGSRDEEAVNESPKPKRRAPQPDERRAAPTSGRREPSLTPEARKAPPQGNRAPPDVRRSAPQPTRTVPDAPPAPPPARKIQPKPGERRTPFIKSID